MPQGRWGHLVLGPLLHPAAHDRLGAPDQLALGTREGPPVLAGPQPCSSQQAPGRETHCCYSPTTGSLPGGRRTGPRGLQLGRRCPTCGS